jgi:uncharacterized protein YraI
MSRQTLPILFFLLILVISACQAEPPVAEQPIATEEPLPTEEVPEVPEVPEEPKPTKPPPEEPTQALAPIATTMAVEPTAPSASGPQPTPIMADPATVLGEPTGMDTFETGANWPQSTNDCFSAEVKDGKYFMTALGEANQFCWEVSWPLLKDYYMEVITQPEACNPGDLFGLFFRAPDNTKGYMYGVTCDGRYTMGMWDGSKTTVFADFVSNPAIQPGQGATNRIGVLANGDIYDLYANGTYLERIQDATFTGEGKIGFFVRPSSPNGFTTTFDDLKLWEQLADGTVSSGDPIPVETPQAGSPTVTANTPVNVRSGPSTDFPILGGLQAGESAEVVGKNQDGSWWAIDIPTSYAADGIGWVSAAFVTASNTDSVQPIPTPTPPANIQPPEGGAGSLVLVKETLNVYAGPGKEFDVLGKLPANTIVPVNSVSSDGRWLEVGISGGTGWIRSAYTVPVQ